MDRLRRLLLITFLESFATVCVERGVYFFSHEHLGFSDAANLALALVFGVAYVLGALSSQRLSRRLTEKKLLSLAILGQVPVQAVLAVLAPAGVLFAGVGVVGFLNGLKWPVMESYVSAGRTPSATARAIGRFNIAWSASVPAALVTVGPILSGWANGLFVLPAAISLVSLYLIRPLAGRPLHLPADHPERPAAGQLARFRGLLGASRWNMLASYSTLWVMAALMPRIFQRELGFAVAAATALSAVVDLVRLGAFAALGRYHGWHDRAGPLVGSIMALPAGFFMVLFGRSVAVVLAGEVVFGLAAGMTYYAALYYAMVVENASVGAGGIHEGLIGLGFAAGPAAGLAGIKLSPFLAGEALGLLAGTGPLLVVCWTGALRSLRGTSKRDRSPNEALRAHVDPPAAARACGPTPLQPRVEALPEPFPPAQPQHGQKPGQ